MFLVLKDSIQEISRCNRGDRALSGVPHDYSAGNIPRISGVYAGRSEGEDDSNNDYDDEVDPVDGTRDLN